MTTDDFKRLQEAVFKECLVITEKARVEYSEGEDRLAYFHQNAQSFDVTALDVAGIFAGKHWAGIQSWIRGNRNQRDSLRGRVVDLINYLCFIDALAGYESQAQEGNTNASG